MPRHRPVPSCLQIKMADNSCYTQGTYALGDLCSSKLDNSLRIQPPYRAPAIRDVPCGGQRPRLVAHHTCRVPMQGACDENEDVLGDLGSSTFHTWDHHRSPVLGKSSYFIFRFWKSHFRFLKGESKEFSHKKPAVWGSPGCNRTRDLYSSVLLWWKCIIHGCTLAAHKFKK